MNAFLLASLMSQAVAIPSDMGAAARDGDAKAMITMGGRAAQASDHKLAVDWWAKAAAANEAWGYINLAVYYHEGIEVPVDLVFACTLLRAASTLNLDPRTKAEVEQLDAKHGPQRTAAQQQACDAALLAPTFDELTTHQPGPLAQRVENAAWIAAMNALPDTRQAATPKPGAVQRVFEVEFKQQGIGIAGASDQTTAWVKQHNAVQFPGFTVGVPDLESPVDVKIGVHPGTKLSSVAFMPKDNGAESPWLSVVIPLGPDLNPDDIRGWMNHGQRLAEVPSDYKYSHDLQTPYGKATELVILNELHNELWPLDVSGRARVHPGVKIDIVGIARLTPSDGGYLVVGVQMPTGSRSLPDTILAAASHLDSLVAGVKKDQ